MMKKSRIGLSLLLFFINLSAFAKPLNTGPWKFILKTTNAEIPFIVELDYDKNKVLTGKLRNGGETILLTDITHKGKEITIPLGPYESVLDLTQQDEGTLSGALIRLNKNPVTKTAVFAVHGLRDRFKYKPEKPNINLTGKWSVILEDSEDNKSPGIGVFTQDGNSLTGSILTPTGDYRYMEGYVIGNRFEAASFDGSYNYLFRGVVKNGRMEAALLSNSRTKVTGHPDPKALLPDAYKQTEIDHINFIFPNLKGQNVSLNHPKFKQKPVIIQIFGSWCPNCLDEMNYLIPWYKKNQGRGIEVVALAFERSLSPEDATKQLLKVQKKYEVPYPILQAGSTAEDKPMEKIVGLKNFISFPTTIFLDRQHKVIKVHAGFSGPGTGEYFETWKTEFNQTVNQMLKK